MSDSSDATSHRADDTGCAHLPRPIGRRPLRRAIGTVLLALIPAHGIADPCLDRIRAAGEQPPAVAIPSLDTAAAEAICAPLADLLRFRALEIAHATGDDPCAIARRAEAFTVSETTDDELRATAARWAAEHRRACDAARPAPTPAASKRPARRVIPPKTSPAKTSPAEIPPTEPAPPTEPPAAPSDATPNPVDEPSPPPDGGDATPSPPEDTDPQAPADPPPDGSDATPPPPDEDGSVYIWTGLAITSAVGSVILWGWGMDAAADRDAAWAAWREDPAGSPAEAATLDRFRDARLRALGHFIGGSLTAALAATAAGLALHGWLTADEGIEVTPAPGGIGVRGRF